MTPTTQTSAADPGFEKYLALIRRFPLRRLRSEEELDRAVAVLNDLLDRSLDPWEEEYLDLLGTLIEQFEEGAFADGPSHADLLEHLLDARGVSVEEVSRATGVPLSTLRRVLGGRHSVPPGHVGSLADYFHVEPAVFRLDPGEPG
jgi:antitoxin component HigA of HigAB toxin-antitoxin module